MTPRILRTFSWALPVCALFALATPLCAGKPKEKADQDEITAIRFLGTVDCGWYPESQEVLIDVLKGDPREEVRYEAVKAIAQQLQHGRGPLDPLAGWRPIPDREIFTQIARVATLCRPLSEEEIIERYAQRQEEKRRKDKDEQRRRDACRGCCNEAVMDALAWVAYELDETGCYVEPSERVRAYAERALSLCVDAMLPEAAPTPPAPTPEDPVPPTPEEPVPTPAPVTQPPPSLIQRRRARAGTFLVGRADTTNRFNIFDNMGAEPRSRVWFAYQFVKTQNNAIEITPQTDQLFSILGTSSGRAAFISFTGYGRAPGGPIVDPQPASSEQVLRDLYLEQNSGRSEVFTLRPDTNLFRFGFEYALTPDFSFGMQAQYVASIDDFEQPDHFSNPQVMLKHMVYRGEATQLAAVFGIQPQIPKPDFVIGEDTSRLNPGAIVYHELSDKWFMQGAAGFNFPTEGNQVTTFDYALGLGFWAYRHFSIDPFYDGPPSDKLLLGIVPQFEVLAKHVIGDATVRGQFDLSTARPQTAPGTFSPVDGSTDIFLPQDPRTLVFQEPLTFEEPRHIVDLTAGVTFLFRGNVTLSTGVSVPVTGGTAREIEFISAVNYGF